MKLKSFKNYITEENDNLLRTDTIKSLNAELYDISPKDEGQKTNDIKQLFSEIQIVLDGYDIQMIGDNSQSFDGSVIKDKGQADILLAPKNSGSDGYLPYSNAVLDVKWNNFDGEYALKSVSVKERNK